MSLLKILTSCLKTKRNLPLFCLIVGISGLMPTYAEASFPFDDKDKQTHASTSAGLSAISYLVFRVNGTKRWTSFATSVALVTIVGSIKEIGDKEPDGVDMQANFLGAAGGALFFMTFDW